MASTSSGIKRSFGTTWEDEMRIYDKSNRDTRKKIKLREKDEASNEMLKIKKDKELQQILEMDERKLYLGSLAKETVEKDVKKYFSDYGEIIDVQVMREKESGLSRGFGFVTFSCSFMTDAVFEVSEHFINGQKVDIKRAIPDGPRYNKTDSEFSSQLEEECKNKRSIFVGSLKDSIGEEDLERYFSQFGPVLKATKIKEKVTGNLKTFGFVDFAELGIVKKVMKASKHFIQGKRIRVELSKPRIEFSHQTKTVFVGGLEDGIDDPELYKYFSEFGFVSRAIRIPNKDELKRKFGFVDFDDYEAVDIVVSQRDHFINGHRVRVELALPQVNDDMLDKNVIIPKTESWIEKVKRKLQYAIPDQGNWGETMNNYEVFVSGNHQVKTLQFKIPRGMLEYVVGMGGQIVEGIANDSNTRITLSKPSQGAKNAIFSVTGKAMDVDIAQYIFKKIVKSNIHKLNSVRPITNS